MAVTTLQEAVVVLRGAHQALERLMAETREQELAYFEAYAELGHHPGSRDVEKLYKATGWLEYCGAVDDLLDLLGGVTDREVEALTRQEEVMPSD